MIDALLKHEGNVFNVCIKGHANYSTAGTDIVCAAISALALSFVFFCEKQNDITLIQNDYSPGEVHCIVTGNQSKIKPAYEMLKEGIKGISENYPKNISIRGEKSQELLF